MIHANLRQLKKRRIVGESKREVIMGRTKQGGSVLSFIIVGVVLLAALAGGVYWYRHAFVPHTSPEVATNPASPSESSDSTKNNNSSQSSDQLKSRSSDSSNTSTNSAPSQPAPAQPTAPTPQSSSQLPKTGPADTIGAMLILGVLTAATAAYSQSRRALRSL